MMNDLKNVKIVCSKSIGCKGITYATEGMGEEKGRGNKRFGENR
jgi:hypothetical protein